VTAPKYIAIEGPIGVGKTTLAHRLAARLGGRVLLEAFEENPFLAGFYDDRDRYAMKTQLFFLLERFEQQRREVVQQDLFARALVSDYLFAKDRIFACLTLDELELGLYDRVYHAVAREVPKPDLVLYLTARLDVLAGRIDQRGRSYERDFDAAYLESVRLIYKEFFEHYDDTPLLILDTSETNLAEEGSSHFERVLNVVREGVEGRVKLPLPGSLI